MPSAKWWSFLRRPSFTRCERPAIRHQPASVFVLGIIRQASSFQSAQGQRAVHIITVCPTLLRPEAPDLTLISWRRKGRKPGCAKPAGTPTWATRESRPALHPSPLSNWCQHGRRRRPAKPQRGIGPAPPGTYLRSKNSPADPLLTVPLRETDNRPGDPLLPS